MEAAAAGINCQRCAGGNKPSQVPLLSNKMTKNQQKRQRKQEREKSKLNEEQGGKLRTRTEIMKEYSEVKKQLKREREKLMEFDQKKKLERKKFTNAVTTVVAKLTELKSEKRRNLDNTTAKKQKKNNTKHVPKPKPRSAGNQQSGSVNVKVEQVSKASKSSTCLIDLADDEPTVQANCSSGNQDLPMQRVSVAENNFKPFVPKCETCRSLLCCDERIMLHKRQQCSSEASQAYCK